MPGSHYETTNCHVPLSPHILTDLYPIELNVTNPKIAHCHMNNQYSYHLALGQLKLSHNFLYKNCSVNSVQHLR